MTHVEGAQAISCNLQAELASFRKERHRPTILDTQRGFFFRMSNWASTLHFDISVRFIIACDQTMHRSSHVAAIEPKYPSYVPR